VGDERAGDGPAGLRLQDGRLDLDEVFRRHDLPQDGQRLEADVEDAAAVLVGQQVDLALAVPDLSRIDAVPLVGQRPERLGQDFHVVHVDRELTSPAGDHFTDDADPVTQVDQRLDPGHLSRNAAGLEHELNGAALVLQRGEPELAVPALGHHPPGDPGLLTRPGVRRQPHVGRVQLGQRRGPVEPGGIGVDALRFERVALGPAFGRLRGQPAACGVLLSVTRSPRG
jgi:hypothetical protein